MRTSRQLAVLVKLGDALACAVTAEDVLAAACEAAASGGAVGVTFWTSTDAGPRRACRAGDDTGHDRIAALEPWSTRVHGRSGRPAVHHAAVSPRATPRDLLLVVSGSRAFRPGDLRLLREVVERVATAHSAATQRQNERATIASLQGSLLPPEELLASLQAAASYRPAMAGVNMGGDWYDVAALPDGSLLLAVGDAVGHGPRAVATMALARTALRAHLFDGSEPAAAIAKLDRLLVREPDHPLATLVVGILSPDRREFRWSSAGHLPPLVRLAAGPCVVLDQQPGPMVGVRASAVWPSYCARLDPGDVLALYTDGLVERREECIDVGVARLGEALTDADPVVGLDTAAGRVIAGLVSAEHVDDVCLLLTSCRASAPLDDDPGPVARHAGDVADAGLLGAAGGE
jgi:hypothetical protein